MIQTNLLDLDALWLAQWPIPWHWAYLSGDSSVCSFLTRVTQAHMLYQGSFFLVEMLLALILHVFFCFVFSSSLPNSLYLSFVVLYQEGNRIFSLRRLYGIYPGIVTICECYFKKYFHIQFSPNTALLHMADWNRFLHSEMSFPE